MGLVVVVGMEDEEQLEELDDVNVLLRAHGLPEHAEKVVDEDELLDFEMGGYSSLHYLRRIAAHLEAGRALPAPGDDSAPDDPVLLAAYEADELGRFAHLIQHSDAEGFYVPVDFPRPLNGDVTGETLGSSVALRRELRELRELLEIPDGVDPDGDELWEVFEEQGTGDGWRRYGRESFVCVRLLAAAEASVARGLALSFA